jgi:hypothetical protein
MAVAIRFKHLALATVAAGSLAALADPAHACNCGCALPGSGADMTSVSGASTLFSSDANFLYQTSLSFRDVTGSFNENGSWTPKPLGSSLNTIQANLGVTYYPGNDWTFGLLAPMAANMLSGAQWAAQGAVVPIDTMEGQSEQQFGGGLGDISLQTSYVAYRGDFWPSLALWGGVLLPTGNASGDAAATFTGSGIFSAQLGVSALKMVGPVELSAGIGYQRPFSEPAADVSTAFYVGQSVLGQFQANWEILPAWRLGLGASSFYGEMAARDTSPTASKLGKIKLTPSIEWRFMADHGVRLAYGADPAPGPWVNTMTDQNLIFSYYRFM